MTVKLRSKKSAWHEFADAMRSGQDFEASSLTGKSESYVSSWGRLNRELDDFGKLLSSAEHAETLRYVVYSYSTPIAFRFADQWVVTDESYSVTTSQQTGKISVAVHRLNKEAESQQVSDMLEHYGA